MWWITVLWLSIWWDRMQICWNMLWRWIVRLNWDQFGLRSAVELVWQLHPCNVEYYKFIYSIFQITFYFSRNSILKEARNLNFHTNHFLPRSSFLQFLLKNSKLFEKLSNSQKETFIQSYRFYYPKIRRIFNIFKFISSPTWLLEAIGTLTRLDNHGNILENV